jgi:hypothetical protein
MGKIAPTVWAALQQVDEEDDLVLDRGMIRPEVEPARQLEVSPTKTRPLPEPTPISQEIYD